MPAQLGHIGQRQIGKQRAAPALPVTGPAQQRPPGLGAQREALAPVDRRRGVQPQFMVPPPVAQHQQHVAHLQGRRGALLIHPAQQAAAHHHLMLVEQPVGRRVAVHRRAVGGGHVQPRDVPAALRIAPHLQPGVVDQQLLKAQAQRQQRRHRQRGRDLRQAQRLAAPAIVQQHVVQHK